MLCGSHHSENIRGSLQIIKLGLDKQLMAWYNVAIPNKTGGEQDEGGRAMVGNYRDDYIFGAVYHWNYL